jgi:transposase
VLSFPAAVRIYVAVGVTDMRKSFDGLCAATQNVLREDPFSGHVFAFCNRRRNRLKLLLWDRRGAVHERYQAHAAARFASPYC